MQYNENVKPKGQFNFILSDAGTQAALQQANSHDEFQSILKNAISAGNAEVISHSNLVVNAGKTKLAAALYGGTATLAFQQLGTGTTAPNYSDTALQTPSAPTKKAISSVASSGAVVSVVAFWAAGEATGTWKEFGTMFADNTLWNRIAVDITIAADKALTIDGEITIN